MRIEKNIKKYADNKLSKFKDDEFLNSISNAETSKKQIPKPNRKVVMSIVASYMLVLVVVLCVTLTINGTIGYNKAQYEVKTSTFEELNEDCEHYQFASYDNAAVELIIDITTQQKVFYNIVLRLKDGCDQLSFKCIVDKDYIYPANIYESDFQYGDFTIDYRITSTYNEEDKYYTHILDANLLTDKERIEIHYIGISHDENHAFFDLLPSVLLVK